MAEIEDRLVGQKHACCLRGLRGNRHMTNVYGLSFLVFARKWL